MEDDAQMSITHDAPFANTSEQQEDSPREDLPLSCKTMTATNAAGGTFGMGLDQFELPKASIQKLAKSELPDSIQLRKDSLAALVKSSSVFVSYLSTCYETNSKLLHLMTLHWLAETRPYLRFMYWMRCVS